MEENGDGMNNGENKEDASQWTSASTTDTEETPSLWSHESEWHEVPWEDLAERSAGEDYRERRRKVTLLNDMVLQKRAHHPTDACTAFSGSAS